jgi:hypothetical protein
MQKLKLKSIYMLWKSCSSGYTEHNKLGFPIFGFFCDFIQFFQVAGKTHKRGRYVLRVAPWKTSKDHRQGPSLHQTPWNYLGLCNVVQGGKGRRSRPD